MIPESVKALAARLIRFAELNEDTGRVAVGQADAMREAASRLTRQGDETRRAALEEAAKVAEAWALKSPSQLRLHGGEMTAQEVRTAKAFITVVCGAIRALKEAGHG